MQLSVNRKELSKALTIVKRTTGGSPNYMPILGNVLVTAHGGAIELATTDLENATRVDLEAQCEPAYQVETFCLPVKPFAAAVKAHRRDLILLQTLADHRVQVGSATLAGNDPDEYPTVPDGQDHETAGQFPTAVLGAALKQVSYAASTDKTRYNLNGVYFDTTAGVVHLTATDGHRLAQSQVPGYALEGCGTAQGEDGWILPLAFVRALEALTACRKPAADTTYLTRFGDQVGAQVGCVTLYCKRIEGEYPSYRQVIPERNGRVAYFDRDEMLAAIGEVDVVASQKKSHAVTGTIAGQSHIRFEASDPDAGEAQSECGAQISEPAGDAFFGINTAYLKAAIGAIESNRVACYLAADPGCAEGKRQQEGGPLTFAGIDSDAFGIVMPCRI